MIDWLSKNKIEVIILLFMGALINVGQYLQLHGVYLAFQDTDDYMRLVRTKEFFNNYDLSNAIIARSNVPFGCDLHWTRFYDFFIIVPTYILNFFISSIDKSVEYVCFFISPVVKSATIAVFFSVVQKLMKKKDAFLCSAIFAAHPLIMSFGIFGRPDHHAFIMLFIVIYLHSTINIIESKFRDRKACVKAATIAALCVWISPETLIPILLIDGVLFVYSFSKVEGLKCLYMKSLLTACFIGTIFFVSFGSNCDRTTRTLSTIAIFAAAGKKYVAGKDNVPLICWRIIILALILATFPFVNLVEYDKISILHIHLFLCGAFYFIVVASTQKLQLKTRIGASLLLSAIIAGGFLTIYPNFLKGMSAGVDDYVKEIWLYRVAEMKSPFAHGDAAFFATHCVIIAVSIIGKIAELVSRKSGDALIWSILIVNAMCYAIFAGISYRMIPYSALFALPLIIDFGMNGALTKSLHRLSRIIVSAFLSMFFIFVAACFQPENENKDPEKPKYTQRELFSEIDNLSKEPIIIMAHTNDGPSLLYHTKHSVVGAPYHRQTQGIISSHKVMEDEYDEKTVKDILKSTGASYIFVRKSKRDKNKAKRSSLARRIIDNNPPEWLEIVKLPEKFNDIIVAKVVENPFDLKRQDD